MSINRYGQLAQRHWREARPAELAQMDAPEAFFTQLGEDISQEIEARARALAGQSTPEEPYLQRLQRLTSARQTAESEVLRERIFLAQDDASQ